VAETQYTMRIVNGAHRVAWLLAAFVWFASTVPALAQDTGIDWGREGTVSARGMGLPAPSAAEDARRLTARRAAIADAQRNLLEVVEGVTLYGGVTTGVAMATNDLIRTHVSGVLRGAVVLEGSESWDPDGGAYELTMVVPIGDVRRSLPRLRLAADGETILVFASAEASDDLGGDGRSRDEASFEAREDTVVVAQRESVTFDVLTNDSGDPSTFSLVVTAGVSHGTLLNRGGGRFTYQHASAREPLDGFTYMLTDGHGATSIASVTIEIVLEDEDHEVSDEHESPAGSTEEDDGERLGSEDVVPDTPSPVEAPAATDTPDEPGVDRAHQQAPEVVPPASDPAPPPPPLPPDPPVPPAQVEGVGGRALPIRGELPTIVVLDATGYEFDRPFALDISSTSGELVYELAEVHYVQSLADVRQPGAEVMRISAVGHNMVSVVVDEVQAARLRSLFAQRDYTATGDLWIAGGR